MSLAAQTRAYFISQTVIGAAIVNAVINGVIGWLAVLPLPTPVLGMWTQPGVAIDTVLTAFGVAFGTALVVTFTARKDMYLGKVAPEAPSGFLATLVERLPFSLLPRAIVLGVACVVLFVPPPLFYFARAGVEGLAHGPFIAFKALFSAVVGAAVTPLVAYYAMVSVRGRSI